MKQFTSISRDSWFKVLGIGKEGCKVISELSKKRRYLFINNCVPIRKEDFMCIKGITNIDELQYYLPDKSVVWYIANTQKPYLEVLKETSKAIQKKVDFTLLFSIGEIEKNFIYSLTARNYINHVIEPVENANYDNILKAAESLLFLIFGHTLICIDLLDIKSAFSISPIIRANTIDISKQDIKRTRIIEEFCRKIKNPASLLLSIMISKDVTLEDTYYIASFLREKFKNSLLKEKVDEETKQVLRKILKNATNPSTGQPINPDDLPDEQELFYFSAPLNESLREGTIRIAAFWTEKD